MDITVDNSVYSLSGSNDTIHFTGNLRTYTEEVEEYISLSNITFWVDSDTEYVFDKICYGKDDNPVYEICIDNQNISMNLVVENSFFQFTSYFNDEKENVNTMFMFDGVIDESNLSLKDGRMFNTDSSCYNLIYNYKDDYTITYYKRTYCCLSFEDIALAPESPHLCRQFESRINVYESNDGNLYAASTAKFIFAQNRFIVYANESMPDNNQGLSYYTGTESCPFYNEEINACNFSLIKDKIDLKLMFMFDLEFYDYILYGKLFGRIIFRNNEMLMEEGIPYTTNQTCQNFSYLAEPKPGVSLPAAETTAEFCCTEFEETIHSTSFSPSQPFTTKTTTVGSPTTATTLPTTIPTTTTPMSKTKNSTLLIILAVVVIFVSSILAAFIYFVRNKCRQKRIEKLQSDIQEKIEMTPLETKLSHQERVKMRLLPKNVVIDFDNVLGTGSNATVYAATLKGKIPPALKDFTRQDATEYLNLNAAIKIPTNFEQDEVEQFVRELDALIMLKFHPHIITFYGWTVYSNVPALITELAATNLLTHVRNLKAKTVPIKPILSILWQISNALEYLASFKMVHRDVACRNILLMETNNVAKLADLGLCCRCNETLTYKGSLQKQLPLKWLSIEALTERIFSEKSDVWSFGIMVYEIFTYGAIPYPALSNIEMLEFLKDGKRLERPENCPEEIYELMLKCWKEDVAERPNFRELSSFIKTLLENETANYGYLSLTAALNV